jgi:hypothetical protein
MAERGLKPKRAELLELVAALNGAANWNALQGKKNKEKAAVPVAKAASTPQRRVRDYKSTDVPLYIGTTMFDEGAGLMLLLPDPALVGGFDEIGELDFDFISEVQVEGTVASAAVFYPDASRYDVPEYATRRGFHAWLEEEQLLHTTGNIELYVEDLGDDSPARCQMTVYVSKELRRRIYRSFDIQD